MALTVSSVIQDTPTAKSFVIQVPEADAINVDTTLTFTTSGMTVFRGVPYVFAVQNVTPSGTVVTGACNIAIFTATTTNFHVQKTAVAAGAVNQLFQVTMICKNPYEV